MANNFGLTGLGWVPKRWQDIIDEIKANILAVFPNADLNDQSVYMQLVGAFAIPHLNIWEQMEEIFLSQDPNAAEGISLENIGGYIGMEKLAPKSTLASIALQGDQGTIVTAGNIIQNSFTQELFSVLQDVVIDYLAMTECFVEIPVFTISETYTITIGADVISVVATGDLDTLINELGIDLIAAEYSAVICDDGKSLYINDIPSDTVTVTTNLELYKPGFATSFKQETISGTPETLTVIYTPVSGWEKVTNFFNSQLGRKLESDSEFRIRRAESLQIAGAGTLEAMVARCKDDIEDAGQVRGYTNRTDSVDGDGRPPHSYEIIIEGGTGEDIANLLWTIQPAGIQSYGDFYYDVLDSNGDLQRVYYSRPTEIYFYMDIVLTLYSEEIFPANGLDAVKADVLEFAIQEQTIGQDILTDRYNQPIFKTPGIGSTVIRAKRLIGDSWVSGQIAIADDEVAILQSGNLTVA